MCGKNKLIMDNSTGELFCANCGYVITEHIEDHSKEWRSFNKEEYEDRSRTGIPNSLAMHDMGLATVIGPDIDANGNRLPNATRSTIERLRIWDSRSHMDEPLAKNLMQAMLELDRLKDKLAVSTSVIERSAYIYRKALEKGLVRGRSISSLVAAALYTACRDTETPRTLKDIADASNIKRKEIARCYRLLTRELNLYMPVLDPIKCVSRIASNLAFSNEIKREKVKRTAIEILKKAREAKLTVGKDPMGLAATALYVACIMHEERKTQEDIAKVAGVTEVTIRNRFKDLKKLLTNITNNTNNNIAIAVTTTNATTTATNYEK